MNAIYIYIYILIITTFADLPSTFICWSIDLNTLQNTGIQTTHCGIVVTIY